MMARGIGEVGSVGLALLLTAVPAGLDAQGYRVRLDTRFQSVEYRGVQLDSILATATVAGPNGGPETPDGYAVNCQPGDAYCTFFREGPRRVGAPLVATADATAWGFGVRGLSAHATARLGYDLSSDNAWVGVDPALQLVVGYVEYAAPRFTARAGRQLLASRLGSTGFDGGSLTWRLPRQGIDLSGFLGWGLARGVALPVTSPALNPLDEFQPEQRQIVAGLEGGWSTRIGDVRLFYQREVDPHIDKFVSERVAISGSVRPAAGWAVSGGADYDMAFGWWGSADLSVAYSTRGVAATLEARRYRPHFDLWTIWGAFSPVPYHSLRGNVTWRPSRPIQLHARGEVYRFDPADVSAPLVPYETDGYRSELGATIEPAKGVTLDAGLTREFGPGAASAGTGGSVTYSPTRSAHVTLYGSSLDRPLEFRYSESALRMLGFDGAADVNDRVRLSLGAIRYAEERRRPDAAAFDWTQWRITAGVVVLFAHGGDLENLPPAIRRMPGGRNAR
ncbi:MAG TPA: hypothetical protein VG454_08235 [Gemmatimonadales bacterium]|nr:hypothetical protein [Gemmatimonadales bacterium]